MLLIARAERRRAGPHLFVLRSPAGDEIWTYDFCELRACVRPVGRAGARAVAQWELRRRDEGLWEMRSVPVSPPDLPVFMPTHWLRPPRQTLEPEAPEGAPPPAPYRRSARSEWIALEARERKAVEEAHQRYVNG